MQRFNTANPRRPMAIYSTGSGSHAIWVETYPCSCEIGRCDGALADGPAHERGCIPNIQAAF